MDACRYDLSQVHETDELGEPFFPFDGALGFVRKERILLASISGTGVIFVCPSKRPDPQPNLPFSRTRGLLPGRQSGRSMTVTHLLLVLAYVQYPCIFFIACPRTSFSFIKMMHFGDHTVGQHKCYAATQDSVKKETLFEVIYFMCYREMCNEEVCTGVDLPTVCCLSYNLLRE